MSRMLHLFSRRLSPADQRLLLGASNPGDAVLLLGPAAACALGEDCRNIVDQGIEVYVLSDDLARHGLGMNRIGNDMKAINYDEFVTLTESHPLVRNWQ